MAKVAFDYDGVNTITAIVTSGIPGTTYWFGPDTADGSSSGVADGSGAVTITQSVALATAGLRYGMGVQEGGPAFFSSGKWVGISMFKKGTAGVYASTVNWSMSADHKSVTATFPSTIGEYYYVQTISLPVGGSDYTVTPGTGGSLTITQANETTGNPADAIPIVNGIGSVGRTDSGGDFIEDVSWVLIPLVPDSGNIEISHIKFRAYETSGL